MAIKITFPQGTDKRKQHLMLSLIMDFWGSDEMANAVYETGLEPLWRKAKFKVE